MSTAVIGATGRVGSEIVRGVLACGDAVTALVRDPDKARRAFGQPGGLRIRPTRLDDPRDLAEAFDGIRTVFIAMGSIGIAGVLQRIAINAAAGIPSIEQVTRLSVLNTSADSLGINQRAHDSIDQLAASAGVPYSTRTGTGGRRSAGSTWRIRAVIPLIVRPTTVPQSPGKNPSPCAPPAIASQLSTRIVPGVTADAASGQFIWRTSIHWNVGRGAARATSRRCASNTPGRRSGRQIDWSG